MAAKYNQKQWIQQLLHAAMSLCSISSHCKSVNTLNAGMLTLQQCLLNGGSTLTYGCLTSMTFGISLIKAELLTKFA